MRCFSIQNDSVKPLSVSVTRYIYVKLIDDKNNIFTFARQKNNMETAVEEIYAVYLEYLDIRQIIYDCN